MAEEQQQPQGNSCSQSCLGLGCIVFVIIAIVYVVMVACGPSAPEDNQRRDDGYCPGGVAPQTVYDPETDKIVVYCP